ncbi:hypothetical protein H6F68_11575 [Trichocoleus sp. FACHB-262]|nr:hypothetical protein [Trichocoleus sp. FACHB-262]
MPLFAQANAIQTAIARIPVHHRREVLPQVIQFRLAATAQLLQDIDIHKQLTQRHPTIYAPKRHRAMQRLDVIVEAR